MKIKLSSIFVDDQAKALAFYTDILGFVKNQQIPLGEFDWLTVKDATGISEIELVLEPNANPAAKEYQQALFEQGIPATAFEVEGLSQEVDRLKKLDVEFTTEPMNAGGVDIAVFVDTCGNLIQLYQPN